MSQHITNKFLKNALTRYANREARVVIIGLGYVGLPLAVEFAHAGFSVLGLDVAKARVDSINLGHSPVVDISDAALRAVISSGYFRASVDLTDLAGMDAFVICVPTPLRKTKEPDISFVISATEFIRPHLKAGQLIVLESTTYPGTTDELILGMLEAGSGLKADRDFFLAFSPERVDPGNSTFSTRNITKVVGGIGENSTKAAVALYSQVLDKIHAVSSARVAETAKLLENTFRAVNIGLVNEIAQLCHELNIDVWEVVNAAATKPFGFMPFYPGPGIGGHCIPLDPHYLAWRARLSGFEPRFIALADQVNSNMPRYVVSRVADLLNDVEKSLKGSHILVFGVAYKANIDDSRESPALEVIHFLTERGAIVRYVDSYIASVKINEELFSAVPLDDAVLAWADVGVVLTSHSDFDWIKILPAMKLVFDTRNAIKLESTKVVKL